MGNEIDDSTTSQHTDAENPDSGSGEGVPQGNEERSGVEARINELTAKFRSAERRAEQAEAQAREAMAVLTQRLAQPQVTQEPDNTDPDLKAALERHLSPLQQEIRKLSAKLEAQGVEAEVRQQVGSEYPVEVVQIASRVMAEWKINGVRGNLEDALDYAFGKYTRAQQQQGRTAEGQRQNFNRSASQVLSGQGGSGSPSRKGAKTLSDTEIEQLSPDQQEAYWASRIDPNEPF